MDTTSAWEKSAAHHADGVKAYTACPSVRSSGSLLGHLILIHGLRLESIRLGPAHFDSKELLQHFCFGLPQGANGLQDLLTVHARRQTNTHTHTHQNKLLIPLMQDESLGIHRASRHALQVGQHTTKVSSFIACPILQSTPSHLQNCKI